MRPGQLHDAVAVRHLLPEACPVGALADLVVQTFGTPGKLTEANLLEGFIFHAPNSPCSTEMTDRTVGYHVGGLLRAVGVQCDLTVWEEGKPCTTHALKKFSLWTVSRSLLQCCS